MGRQLRVTCLGDGRDLVVRLACLCIDAARPDDAFEFMIDSSGGEEAALEAATCVEMLWADRPNVASAHLSDKRHELLLGAGLVVDFSLLAEKPGGAGEDVPTADALSHDAPVIDDWEHPVPHAVGGPRGRRLSDEDERRKLELDMSLLCPRAVLVAPAADENFDELVGDALDQALERAAAAEKDEKAARLHRLFKRR